MRHTVQGSTPARCEFLVFVAGKWSVWTVRRRHRLSNGFTSTRTASAPRGPQVRKTRSARALALGLLLSLCCGGHGLAKDGSDDDDDAAPAKPAVPNLYLDMRTIYTTVPAGALAIGFSPPPLLSTLPGLASLSNLSAPSSRSLAVDLPFTVDLNDKTSVYGGVSGTTSQAGTAPWTDFAVTSWTIGFQADIYSQNGGKIPTITMQTNLTQSIPNTPPLATTTFNTILEADYALNADETVGWLAGTQYTKVQVNTGLATVNPAIMGYVGGYYQWDNNWKFTGRVGVQHFGGAQILNPISFPAFTQPILRLDLDRMDDNDNRLFGVTAQIAWTPKPSYQLTLRTPLYAVRN